MTHPLSPPSANDPDPTQLSPAAGRFARTIVTLIVLLVPAMILLISRRSYRVHQPSTAIVVLGDSSIDGAIVTVVEELKTSSTQTRSAASATQPDESADPHAKVWQGELKSSNTWQTPVLLDPGNYRVIVHHHGHEILNEKFELTDRSGYRFNPMARVSILGATGPADVYVSIMQTGSHSTWFLPLEVKLSESNHFRTAVYLYPGNYRAVARTKTPTDRVLTDESLVVDRSGRCRIDLGKPTDAGDDLSE